LEKDPINFRTVDRVVLEESGLFSRSEIFNNGAEIAQTLSLKKMPGFADKYFLPTGLKFFEESVFVLNPKLTNTMELPDIVNLIAHKHKNAPDFTTVALVEGKTYLFSKTCDIVTFTKFASKHLKELLENYDIA
jgi:hypothetical protein